MVKNNLMIEKSYICKMPSQDFFRQCDMTPQKNQTGTLFDKKLIKDKK